MGYRTLLSLHAVDTRNTTNMSITEPLKAQGLVAGKKKRSQERKEKENNIQNKNRFSRIQTWGSLLARKIHNHFKILISKIQRISPGAYVFQRLIFGEACLHFQIS